jgi:hypothetical protein
MYVCMYVCTKGVQYVVGVLWGMLSTHHDLVLYEGRVTERSRSVDLSRPFLQTCGTSIWDWLSRHFNLLAGFN